MTQYGAEIKEFWPLEKDMIFLNHGSYGAAPIAVLDAQSTWRRQLEAQPCQFINAVAPGEIRAAAATLATFVGAQPEDTVFVENTTCGLNAVLRSLQFAPGDEIVISDHIYNATRNTVRFVVEAAGAKIRVAEIGLPVANEDQIFEAVTGALTDATRLLVIDHLASITAVIFPVARIAAAARARGIPVLVDGAHAPGMLDLDVPALGVDWYVGNCHKWLCAPKGAAFLWATRERQAGLHPTVISHDLDRGFTFEFDKIGTRDASAWLSVPAAIAFHEDLGGARMRARCHAVASAEARALAERWGTETGAPDTLFGMMSTVRMPGDLPVDRAVSERLKAWLWAKHRAEIHIMPFGSAFWVRLSVAAYTTEEECRRVGPLIEAAIEAEQAGLTG
ncbi:MAG: aminotransferase class V-fold PLP-dependent enzyme [Pseudomonadota bacterium]